MNRPTLVVLPHEGAEKIRNAGSVWGNLMMSRYGADDMYVVTSYQAGMSGTRFPVLPAAGQQNLRRRPEDEQHAATWHRTTFAGHWHHYRLTKRLGTAIPVDDFRRLVPTVQPPGSGSALVITHAPDVKTFQPPHPIREFAAWYVTRDGVSPFDLAVEPGHYGLEQLVGHWPVERLGNKRVLVVGVGSIGGVIACQLAAYGVGHLDLLDPDRLLWHNIVRHVLTDGQTGRFKVEALADMLAARWPSLQVVPRVWDVVDDADLVRVLLPDVDAIVCSADGVAPRRVVSHLARRAGKDAVLTSVLEDGAFGEVLRLRRAKDHGCLLCRRAPLFETGRMDPERVLERGYGDGDPHRPMTAVGPDLALVGNLAAKVVVASLLDREGQTDQRLPGEQAVIALRPLPGYDEPFDLARAGQINWHPATPPLPGCVTCSPP